MGRERPPLLKEAEEASGIQNEKSFLLQWLTKKWFFRTHPNTHPGARMVANVGVLRPAITV